MFGWFLGYVGKGWGYQETYRRTWQTQDVNCAGWGGSYLQV